MFGRYAGGESEREPYDGERKRGHRIGRLLHTYLSLLSVCHGSNFLHKLRVNLPRVER